MAAMEGGTMMLRGIQAALDFPHSPSRLRFVRFLTDGYIGNEVEILGAIQPRLGSARIFSFGIGTAVNRYLLEHLAKLGRGAMAYLGANDSAATLMDAFMARTSHPALTDLKLDWAGAIKAPLSGARPRPLGARTLLSACLSGRQALTDGATPKRTRVSALRESLEKGAGCRPGAGEGLGTLACRW